jgi:hypothetical protein
MIKTYSMATDPKTDELRRLRMDLDVGFDFSTPLRNSFTARQLERYPSDITT